MDRASRRCPRERPSPCSQQSREETRPDHSAHHVCAHHVCAQHEVSPTTDGDLTETPALDLLIGLTAGLFLHPTVRLRIT